MLLAAAVALATAACTRAESSTDAPAADQGPAAELRIGYFPNVTHAAALIGVERGLFAQHLGTTKLTTQTFNAGPEAVNALLGGSLDISFIGSGPAINTFAKSGGEAVRLISGATSGGAQLVARRGITEPEQLRGRSVATPQLGNTQDIALKKWLAQHDLAIGTGADRVTVVNADNPQTLEAFRGGQIDAAWLPEPWSSRLVRDAGARVLLDERQLWPGGAFPTTVVVVRTAFLAEHPQTVRAFLSGLLDATEWASANRDQARDVVNAALGELTGKPLSPPVIERAFGNITLTVDPLAATFPQLARDSVTAGVAKSEPNLAGLVDLDQLNAVLAGAGMPAVDAAGLDRK
jgi:NitT/TauT family transport system substrate-binding protein